MPTEPSIPKRKWPYLHPIPVHFPQALFPAAFMSLMVYLYSGAREYETAAYIMLIFGLMSIPVTAATGFADWKIRYRGQMTRVFRIKIIGAMVLFILSLSMLLIRLQHPEVTALPLDWIGWTYVGLLTACQIDCMIIGYYGGRLVFH